MFRHRSVSGAMLPAAVIAAALLGGTGATYALVGYLHRTPPRAPGGQQAAGGSLPSGISPGPTVPSSLPGSSIPGRSGPGPASAPSAMQTEKEELAQISALLRRSASVRAVVVRTTSAVGSCSLAPGIGLQRMDLAIASRRGLIASAASLTLSAIPSGGQLQTDLVAALRLSLAADRGFARWMGQMRSTGVCPGPMSGGPFLAGVQESVLAGLAKGEFVRLWDPLAAGFGQATYASRQI